MRKPSKMVPRKEMEDFVSRCWLYETALSCVMRDRPFATETVKEADSGCRYRLALYARKPGFDSIVVQTFICSGQRDTVTAFYLSEFSLLWAGDMGSMGSEFRLAAHRLRQAELRSWDVAA